MATRISAADLHLKVGDILARIRYAGERFIVERRGVPIAAIVTVDELERLDLVKIGQRQTKEQRLAALAQARAVRQLILARRGGIPLPDSAALIQEMREERDRELENLH